MRKKFLTSLAGTLAAVAVVTSLATTSVVAAPGATQKHLGEVLPGALTEWGGVAGWVDANSAAITAQGYDPVAAKDPSSGDCLTVNAGAGSIAVGASCPAGMDVGYAVGDADGMLSITLGGGTLPDGNPANVHLTFKQGVPLFTLDEVLALVPELTMTINNDGPDPQPPAPRDYTVNIQTGVITPISPVGDLSTDEGKANTQMDQIVHDNADFIINDIKTTTGPLLLNGLTDGLTTAFASRVQWAGNLPEMPLPVSFGYPFDGQLTNGQTGRVTMKNVLANTWASQFDQFNGLVFSMPSAVPLSDLTLTDLLPAGTPGQSLTDSIPMGDAVRETIVTAFQSSMDIENDSTGIWLNAAGNVLTGLNQGLYQMNDTMPLAEVNPQLSNTIAFTRVPSDAQKGSIWPGLKKMTPTKVPDWLQTMSLNGPLTVKYLPGKITHLTPTGITVTAPTATSEPPTSSSEPSQSTTPTTEPPTSSSPSPSTTAPSTAPSSPSTPSVTTGPPTSTAPTTSAPSSSTRPTTTPGTTSPSTTTPSSSTPSHSVTPPPTTPSATSSVTPSSAGTPSSTASSAPTTAASTAPSPSATSGATPSPSPTVPGAGVAVTPTSVTLVVVNGQLAAPVQMTAVGTGFKPGEAVTGVMYSAPLNLPAQVADAAGRVSFTWALPADTTAGSHTVVLTGATTGAVTSNAFTVTRSESTVPTTPGGPGKGNLATTGPDAATNFWGLFGLGAVAIGLITLALANKKAWRGATS